MVLCLVHHSGLAGGCLCLVCSFPAICAVMQVSEQLDTLAIPRVGQDEGGHQLKVDNVAVSVVACCVPLVLLDLTRLCTVLAPAAFSCC